MLCLYLRFIDLQLCKKQLLIAQFNRCSSRCNALVGSAKRSDMMQLFRFTAGICVTFSVADSVSNYAWSYVLISVSVS